MTKLESGIAIHHVSGLRLGFAVGFMEAVQITSIQARSCNPQSPSYRQIEVPGNDWPVINAHGGRIDTSSSRRETIISMCSHHRIKSRMPNGEDSRDEKSFRVPSGNYVQG